MCQRCAINQKSLRLAFVHRDLPPTDNNLLSQTGDDESICILKSKYRSIVEKMHKEHKHTHTHTTTHRHTHTQRANTLPRTHTHRRQTRYTHTHTHTHTQPANTLPCTHTIHPPGSHAQTKIS